MQPLTDEDRDDRAEGQERSERHGGLASGAADGHQRDADDRAGEEADEQTRPARIRG